MTRNQFCQIIFILGLVMMMMSFFSFSINNKIDKLQESLDAVESQLSEFGKLEIKQ